MAEKSLHKLMLRVAPVFGHTDTSVLSAEEQPFGTAASVKLIVVPH